MKSQADSSSPLTRVVAVEPDAEGFSCDPAEQAVPGELRRLSSLEYRNTLTDLFEGEHLSGALGRAQSALSQLPPDGEAEAVFSRMDARLGQRHVAAYLATAEALSRAVTDDDAALAALAGPCALAADLDEACFDGWLTRFGKRVFRRPPTSAERRQGMSRAQTSQNPRDAYRQTLAGLLSAPAFLFHVETGPPAPRAAAPLSNPPRDVARDRFDWPTAELTPYELAARLSYQFWESMPDAELMAAADSGALQTEAGYEAQLQRLTQHQRARSTWYRFFREWLGLDHFTGFANDQAFYDFAGNVAATPQLYEDAVWEVEQLVGHYTFDTHGTLSDLLTTNLIMTRSRRVAELYRIEPWDGTSVPRRFPRGHRSGLLTRAALLISASHATNPFERGAFVRRRLLCEPIEPPAQRPPEALSVPRFDPSLSTRQRYEAKVEPWECKGCHELFSPFGYVLERYDALGRYREQERLLDEAGGDHGTAPIDSSGRVSIAGQRKDVDGPVALSEMLASSARVEQCFVRQYFRFSFRRKETPADGCTLDALLAALSTEGLAGLQRGVALTPAFRQRRTSRELASSERGPHED